MENTLKKYKEWILKAVSSSTFNVVKLNWPDKLGLNLFDYSIDVTIDNIIFSGRGSDVVEDIALCKAMSETYERFCVYIYCLKNTNGCAAHYDLEIAKNNAIEELVERDCFLFKYITAENLKKASYNVHNVQLDSKAKLFNYILHLDAPVIALSRITINSEANIFGLGIGKNIDEAFRKSEVETLRQYASLISDFDHKKYSYEFISAKKSMTFEDHGNIALTKKHYDSISYIFNFDASEHCANRKIRYLFERFDESKNMYKVWISKFASDHPFFEIPLFFVKASNIYAQELFTGATCNNINRLRIQNTEPESLNLCLHPFQ